VAIDVATDGKWLDLTDRRRNVPSPCVEIYMDSFTT